MGESVISVIFSVMAPDEETEEIIDLDDPRTENPEFTNTKISEIKRNAASVLKLLVFICRKVSL